MSKSAKSQNCESSTSETGKSAIKTEKIRDNGAQTRRPVAEPVQSTGKSIEIGGQAGPEPTRFGDWEKNGRCTDF